MLNTVVIVVCVAGTAVVVVDDACICISGVHAGEREVGEG
jgi:hypothetical protein